MNYITLFIILGWIGVIVSYEFINFADVPCENINHGNVKIIGGGDALPGEFPWLVSLTRRGNHFCGGSLISRRHVLTAGHCVCNGADGFINPASIKVTIGQHDLESEGIGEEMLVTSIAAHPDYKCNKARNDLAILELNSDVIWSLHAQPACFSNKLHNDGAAIVAGWGRTSENNTDVDFKKTSVLQKVNVAILNNDICKSWYLSQGKKTKIHETQLCAGRKEGGVDSCWADSGGPLMTDNEDSHRSIVGVVSTGIGCGRPYLPGIYTRVSEFLPWIQSEVDKSNVVA